ncbi:MAG TPA: protein-disulfide reductase DsbD domain-containing protein [Azospirillaceae bacterium]|nr:protein-disulfide reductase DsbD domain-containing protein [Azospirillaceae bacterium]
MKKVWSALLALLALAGPALANPVRTENVEAELSAEPAAVAPGQPFWVALTHRIRPGWHTYWINPGDSGLPTTIEWTLPQGWTAGPIVWPAPERHPVGPLMNFGYHGEVHLLVQVTPAANAPAGGTAPLRAKADWLVCEEICIPESAELALDVPVAASPAVPTAAMAKRFADARAALPTPSPFTASLVPGTDAHRLKVAVSGIEGGALRDAFFYPEQDSLMEAAAPQALTVDAEGLTLAIKPGFKPPAAPVRGVLELVEEIDGKPVRRSLALEPTLGAAGAGTTAAADTAGLPIWQAALLALLGGIVLNLMPCVFPVLSLKALALVHEDGRTARRDALAYTAGVLASFALIAGVLLALRAGGAQIGWGFQLQSPLFVAVLAHVLFLLGLSLSGVFTVGGGIMGVGQGLASRGGMAGSFFTGVLATLVATPCTAPFMGAAIGFALLQPWPVALGVFLALGLGLALPFLLLAFVPGFRRMLPKPGLWMERMKQVLAFPLYASAAWLVWVLSIQAGPQAVAGVLAGMVILAFAAWLYGITRHSSAGWRHGGATVAVLALAGAVLLARAPEAASPDTTQAAAGEGWERFSETRLAELTGEGRPVFVNFTAAWCITCLVNERAVLSTGPVKAAFADRNVTYLKGDWTNRDAEISRVLERFGRNGVPLYLVYLPGKAEPLILPQILTEGAVLEALSGLPVKTS